MSDKPSTDGPERAEEAADLARDAADAASHGNKEEAEFLADAARALDRDAADAVLKKE
jgi:hypothetical protein